MNNIDLRVQKWNDYNNIIPIQDVCTSIKMNCSLKNITTELQFTIGYEYNDYYYFNYEIGDNIYLYINGKLMFCGKITDSTFNLSENTSTFICYDLAWWVVKNNITYNFNREMSVKDALIRVFGAFDFFEYDNIDTYELGKYADMKISKHRIKNKPAKDVLMAIMSDITRVNGIYYYIHMTTTGRIAISECDKYYSGLTIQKSSSNVVDGNLINYTVNRSMQNVVNQYRVYDSNCKEVLEKPLRPVGFDDNDKKRYGIIQDTVILDKDEDLETAIKEAEKEDADELTWNDQTKIVNNYNSKILKIKNQLEVKGYPETEVTVKCIGDINYKVGYGVMCKLPDSEFYDKFMYITASEFEFIPNSDYWINTLTLSTSKKQELTLWEDIEEVVTDENGNIIQGGSILGSSTVVKKALEWAYQTANDNSVGYSMNPNLRNGPDYYDCSAFVIHAYRAGGLSLSNSTYTGDMYAPFLAEGFDDVTSEVNLSTGEGMIAGDVLLNTISHTEIYTGNGKMIGAHSAKIAQSDQVSEKAYNNHPWNYVLRYAITDKTENSDSEGSNGLVSNKYIELLKELEGCDLTLVCRDGDVPTLGYGFTGNEIGGRTTITEAEASAELVEKINNRNYGGAVKKKLDACGISVTQNKFDALTDLAYNAGSGVSDKAIDMLSNGASDNDICAYFKTIIHDGNGNVMAGLVKRRQLNCDMWLNGKYYNPY